MQACEFMYKREDILHELSALLEAPISKLPTALVNYQKELKSLREQVKRLVQSHLQTIVADLMKRGEKIGDTSIFTNQVAIEKGELITVSNLLIEKSPSSAIFLVSTFNQTYHILVRLTPDLAKKELAANKILQEVLQFLAGRGGGNSLIAQATLQSLDRISDAFTFFKSKIKEQC